MLNSTCSILALCEHFSTITVAHVMGLKVCPSTYTHA